MQDEYLKKIKNILLRDDRAERASLKEDISALKGILSDLEKKIEETADTVVEHKVPVEIKKSEETIKEMLAPSLGQMIRKYIIIELEKLSERIDAQVERTFTFNGIKRQFMALIKGVKPNELILDNMVTANVEQVYVIEQHSGLLVGQYSKGNIVDQDMIAGMLTAIKAFVDDAFQHKTGSLDMIAHGTFKIILQNTSKYYIAIVVSGTVKTSFRSYVMDLCLDFADHYLDQDFDDIDDELVSQKLKEYFAQINPEKYVGDIKKKPKSKEDKSWNWKNLFKF